MKVGIIVGSIRDGRVGRGIADWVYEIASKRDDAEYELIDLKEFNVPLLTSGTHPMAAKRKYDSEEVQAWSNAIDPCDAYVFVTPEYNHGVPGALKNAVDCLGEEWIGKTIAFVGYGSVGGVRAIEHWRSIVANFSMVDIRAEVNISLFADFKEGTFTPIDRRPDEVNALFDALVKAAS
ncbi:NADPH-dependent FMN reductase [Tessaracoccus flavus]|uniref:NADPH-dependent FMN reductase n=1 Tax=Tessaracoccus flavus TaxID=1610493 RepID=A0A1Q2CI71_9ACTN|nr:NAD(P)H-dependent oxidoreductase [Tessaracoccus flavus]AQP45811.1 NADPH-dependent FMN reductase [Tessaracoccus flavus]SDZ14565.1 NAD(P)H-dependent FMN reductase [Tessaracoccus flavus]